MERVTEVSVLTEVSELLMQEHNDIGAFSQLVLLKANKLIGSDIGYICFVEGDDEPALTLRYKNFIGTEAKKWRQRYSERVKIGGPELPDYERTFTGYVAYTRNPHRSGNVRKEKFYKAVNQAIESELAVPILLNGDLLGVINLESREPHFYTVQHEQILQIITRLIAPSLYSLMIREGLRKPLIKVLEKIRGKLDTAPPGVPLEQSEVLSEIASVVAESLDSESCTIWVLNRERTILTLRGASGRQKGLIHKQHQRCDEHALVWRAITQRYTLKYGPGYHWRQSRGAHSDGGEEDVLEAPLLIAPLLARGEVIGVIRAERKKPSRGNCQRDYSEADVQLLNMVQGQIAPTIELSRAEIEHIEHIPRQYSQLSHLLDIVTSDLDLKTVLYKTVYKVPEICQGLNCSIFLWDNDQEAFVLVASKGLAPDLIGTASYKLGEGLTGWVGLHGKPLLLNERTPEILKSYGSDLQWAGKYNEESENGDDLAKRPFLAVPIFYQGHVRGIIRICDKTNRYFTEYDKQILQVISSFLACAIAYGERYKDKFKLLQEIQNLLVLTKGITKLDTGVDEFEKFITEEAARSAAEVLQTDVLTLYKYSDDKAGFETPPIWKGDIRYGEFMYGPIRPDDMLWKIWRDGSQYWPDARRHSLLLRDRPPQDGLLSPPTRFVLREGILSSAGIRLDVGRGPVGVMFLNFRRYQAFNDEKREIIETFASQIALSLEIARLSRRLILLSQEEERARIARDLHDDVGQNLYALTLGLAGLEATIPPQQCSARKAFTRLQTLATATLDATRQVMADLRPPLLDDRGLIPALGLYAESHLAQVRITPHIEVTGAERRLSPQMETALFRIIQEAISNIVKHAEAKTVVIRIAFQPSSMQITVADDGKGFSPGPHQGKPSFGLQGMEERVLLLRGEIKIDSRPEDGTTIAVTIPIGEGPQNEDQAPHRR